jgi:hypothetical protein
MTPSGDEARGTMLDEIQGQSDDRSVPHLLYIERNTLRT